VKISLRSSQLSIVFLSKWSSQALAVLDDEEIIIRPTCLAREAIVFQPNDGICPAIIFGNIIRHLAALWETCVTYVTPESMGS
jgi:hypothetical protein